MKKYFLPLILGSVLLLGGCSYGSQKSGSSSSGAPVQPSPVQNQPAQPQATGSAVSIQNFAFSPASLTIKAGTTVTWTNQDSATHTIKSSSFNSGSLSTGDKFQFTFTNPGTYSYSCGIHPSMQGTIIVQ
jgi:plastocyanin